METYYETNLQIKTPNVVGDFFLDFFEVVVGFEAIQDITEQEIDSIQIIEALGLPDGMSLYSSNDNFTFMGDAVGCLTLFASTTYEMIGVHEINVNINVWFTHADYGVLEMTSLNFNQCLYGMNEYE